MNKRQRVAGILQNVALLDTEMANQVMMAAHTTGRGLVGTFTDPSKATSLCQALRDQDLLVETE
eukprot:scaffold17366_cov182-Amphora_coffeaeformis.AAC.8